MLTILTVLSYTSNDDPQFVREKEKKKKLKKEKHIEINSVKAFSNGKIGQWNWTGSSEANRIYKCNMAQHL